ncbi:MAG: hypothetical protein Kow0029_28040 [Candidatus Rifleibacteriota bacterium]
MNQALVIAEMIVLRSLRNRMIPALLIISLPIIIAAYGFDAANPGFQTLFVKDVGSLMIAWFSLLLTLFLFTDNIYRSSCDNEFWFLRSRVKSRLVFYAGQFLGILSSLFFGILCFSTIFFVFLRFTHRVWFFELLAAAWMNFLECSVLLAFMIFLSSFLSRLLTLSIGVLVYFVANVHVFQSVREVNFIDTAGFALSLLLSVFPDSSLFAADKFIFEQQSVLSLDILISTFYAFFMVCFYLIAAELVSGRKSAR